MNVPIHEVEVCNLFSELDQLSSDVSDLGYTVSELSEGVPECKATEDLIEKLEEVSGYLTQAEDQIGWCNSEINAVITLVNVGDVMYSKNPNNGSYTVYLVTEAPAEDELTAKGALADWGDSPPTFSVKNVRTKEELNIEVLDESFIRGKSYIDAAEVERYREMYAVINQVMVYELEMLEVAAQPTGPSSTEEAA